MPDYRSLEEIESATLVKSRGPFPFMKGEFWGWLVPGNRYMTSCMSRGSIKNLYGKD